MNTVEHFLGYHLECIPHEQTNYVWEVGINFPEAAVQLFIILEQRLDDFELVDHRANTQKMRLFTKFNCVTDLKIFVSQSLKL